MAPAIANGHTTNNGNRAEGGNAGNPDRPALRYWRNKLSTLLVDESENHRILGTAYLTAYGVETRSVSNGRAAMELIFSGARFSLILIDMHMRCMSGAQVIYTLLIVSTAIILLTFILIISIILMSGMSMTVCESPSNHGREVPDSRYDNFL